MSRSHSQYSIWFYHMSHTRFKVEFSFQNMLDISCYCEIQSVTEGGEHGVRRVLASR